MANNASDLIAAELICGLWGHFRQNKERLERLESDVEEFLLGDKSANGSVSGM